MSTAPPSSSSGQQGAAPPADAVPDASTTAADAPVSRANVAAVEGCYQLVLWLIPVLDGLPRRQKFQLGDRLQATALDVLDTLIEAAYTRERAGLLQRANLGLEKLRFWVRLAKDLQLIDFKRHEWDFSDAQ